MEFFDKTFLSRKETFTFVLFLVLGLFIGADISLIEINTVSILLKSFPACDLATAFVLSGLIGIVTAHFYIKLHSWIPLSLLAIGGLFVLFIEHIFMFYAFRSTYNNILLYFVFILFPANYIILLQIFRSLFYRVYDPLQVKKINARIETGIIIGSCISLSLLICSVNSQDQVLAQSYLLSSILLLCIGVIILCFSFYFPSINKATDNVQNINTFNNYYSLFKKPYQRSIVLYACSSAICPGLLDFIFYSIVKDNYETSNEIVIYMAIFFLLPLVVGFLLSTTISTKINNRYGNKISLLILPSALLALSILYGGINALYGYNLDDDSFFLLFIIAVSLKIVYILLHKGFEWTTVKKYFIPIEIELRYNFQSTIEFVFYQIGYLITGFLAYAIIHFLGNQFSDLSFVLVLFIMLWLVSIQELNKQYHCRLQQFLKKEEQIISKNRGDNFEDKLLDNIDQLKGEKLSLYLNVLYILDFLKFKKAILNLLYSVDDSNQHLALSLINKFCMLEAVPILEAILRTKKYQIATNRTFILATYLKLTETESRLQKNNYVEQLIHSKIISEKRFGALLAAYLENTAKIKLLKLLFEDKDYQISYTSIQVSARSNDQEIYKTLIQKLSDRKYSNVAMTSIINSGEEIFPLLESTFSMAWQTEKIQKIIIKIYEKSRSKKAIPLLLRKMNCGNKNIDNAIIDALSSFQEAIENKKDKIPFRRALEETCQIITWNMSAYIHLIYNNSSSTLLSALKSEIEDNYTLLFKLLSLFYNANLVSQIKENIDSSAIDKKEFALQLAETMIEEELKPILLPFLSKDSYDSILKKLEHYFLLAPTDQKELLYDLIQRDYKWISRWTKACAIKELKKSGNYLNADIFTSNLLNPEPLLQEASADALSKVQNNTKYLPERKFDMICFLRETDFFKEISFTILLEIVKQMEVSRYKKNELLAQYELPEQGDYLFVKEGAVELINNKSIYTYTRGNFIHFLNYSYDQASSLELKATEDSIVYKIKREVFHELIFFHKEIAEAILSR